MRIRNHRGDYGFWGASYTITIYDAEGVRLGVARQGLAGWYALPGEEKYIYHPFTFVTDGRAARVEASLAVGDRAWRPAAEFVITQQPTTSDVSVQVGASTEVRGTLTNPNSRVIGETAVIAVLRSKADGKIVDIGQGSVRDLGPGQKARFVISFPFLRVDPSAVEVELATRALSQGDILR